MADPQTSPNRVLGKVELRARLSASRAAMSEVDRELARQAISAVVLHAWPTPGRIAAYEPLRTEPGSTALLSGLLAAGHDVIVPITLPDNDLDWRQWRASDSSTHPLGVHALGSADLVLAPAFAVDRTGNRLGRGGGSYDRALRRVGPNAVLAAVLFADEVLDQVPADSWDVPVQAVLTPNGFSYLH